MRKSVSHYPGPEVISADVTVVGKLKADQFRATSDGTDAEKAFTWDADPDLGLKRTSANTMVAGIAANAPLTITQFSAAFGEGTSFVGATNYTNYTTPAALGAGPTANYSPAGWNASRSGIRQDMSAAGVISGLVATSTGNRQILWNISTVAGRNITLNHEDAASTAANRFTCPNLANFVLAPGEGCVLEYDGATSRWRVLGTV